MSESQVWDLRINGVGALGAPFARGRMDAASTVLVHAAPQVLDVSVHDDSGNVVAAGASLTRTADTPIARLRVHGATIEREDVWPTEADTGTPVILMGGEIGVLQRWWNSDDRQEWRWSIELYNHR